jgi:ferric-dicitrate binding protein FerR (iron transport regulator)
MPVNRLNDLLQRYLNRQITPEEHQELMLLLQQPDEASAVKAVLDDVWQQLVVDRSLPADKADALFQAILAADAVQPAISLNEQPVRRLFIFKRIAVAAAILVLIATGWWYYDKQTKPVPATTAQRFTNDLPPGKNNAVLILADGRRINLDSIADGQLASQGNVIIKKSEGKVVYDFSNGSNPTHHAPLTTDFNTITTARGNQYQLILPDGSSIWLNAESSVRFPVAFTGKERRVEVTGEVYLAVKHNNKMPFKVVANGVEVRDLGTEFNVNAYGNEAGVQTTVVEGRVQVIGKQASRSPDLSGHAAREIAVPGQQITVSEQGDLKLIKDADVDAAIAWKNGQFMFTGNSIQSVMRQLERWYDIDVSYAPNVSTEEFVGTITRFSNISAVLKMLEKTGTVHFEVKGRKVLVK